MIALSSSFALPPLNPPQKKSNFEKSASSAEVVGVVEGVGVGVGVGSGVVVEELVSFEGGSGTTVGSELLSISASGRYFVRNLFTKFLSFFSSFLSSLLMSIC